MNNRPSGSIPRKTTINDQPHMLAYINPQEAMMLKSMGGSGQPGPGGIPAFAYGMRRAKAVAWQATLVPVMVRVKKARKKVPEILAVVDQSANGSREHLNKQCYGPKCKQTATNQNVTTITGSFSC